MKVCSKCGGSKPESEFYTSRESRDGLNPSCKPCCRLASQASLSRLRAQSKLGLHLRSAKARAARDGVPFTITESDIKTPARCPIFGVRLIYDGGGRGYGAKPDAASLDRVYPERGYVPGNVVVVSWRANRTKCMLTPKELKRMSDFYSRLAKAAS